MEVSSLIHRILSSKLYKTSTRKSNIYAAMLNPVNSELVLQLKEYLQEEYNTPEYLNPDLSNLENYLENTSEQEPITVSEITEEPVMDTPQTDVKTTNTNETTNSYFAPDVLLEEMGNISEDTTDISNVTEENSDVTVTQSVHSTGTSITASSFAYCSFNMPDVSNEIKGLLNSKMETTGVNRVTYLVVPNELWVYYDDKINLNNVMGPVLELLNAASYTYLQFNRLARTDNAIVFQVELMSSTTMLPSNEVGDNG